MINIYLMDLEEEAIVDLVNDHKELYDKSKNISRIKEGRCVCGRNLPTVASCLSSWARPGLICRGKLTQTKSEQAAKEMSECQNWICYKFGFLRSHILRVVRIQVPGWRSQYFCCFSLHWHRQHGDQHAVNRHHITALTSHQPVASGHSSVDQQVMDQFIEMRTMLSSFQGDNTYSLLQLSGIGSGGIRQDRLSDI